MRIVYLQMAGSLNELASGLSNQLIAVASFSAVCEFDLDVKKVFDA